jgi:hypothetical protein
MPFSAYISGSAILNATYDCGFITTQLAAPDGSNPIQLYLSVGELEGGHSELSAICGLLRAGQLRFDSERRNLCR